MVLAGKHLLKNSLHQPAKIATGECAGFSSQIKIAVGHVGKVPVEPRDPVLRGLCQPLADACPRSCFASQHPSASERMDLRFAASEKTAQRVRQLGCFLAVDQLVERARRYAIIEFRRRSVSQKPTKKLGFFIRIRIQMESGMKGGFRPVLRGFSSPTRLTDFWVARLSRVQPLVSMLCAFTGHPGL